MSVSAEYLPVQFLPARYCPKAHDVLHFWHVIVSVVVVPGQLPERCHPSLHAFVQGVHITVSIVDAPLQLEFPDKYDPCGHDVLQRSQLLVSEKDMPEQTDLMYHPGEHVSLQRLHTFSFVAAMLQSPYTYSPGRHWSHCTEHDLVIICCCLCVHIFRPYMY